MQAEKVFRRHTNEKDVFDHSSSAAIGGLGGCTEHIEFTQQSSINNTEHDSSVFNFIRSIHHSGHKLNYNSDHHNFNHEFE